MLEGGIRSLLADALFPLTALVTTAILTRRLGPDGYGVLVLAVSLVGWIEWSLNSLFARATIKHVGEAEQWQPIGTAAVNLQLMVGTGAMVILWLLAIPISRLLDEPRLAAYLALLALDVPLFCLIQTHRHILTGIGAFGPCAVVRSARWVARFILVVGLVEMGLSISAAVLGTIGASVVELIVARRYVRPTLFQRVSAADWPHWDYALPLFVSAFCVTFFVRIDLFFVRAFGGAVAQAGQYGAAQNLAQLPGLFGMATAPFLLATLSRVRAGGHDAQAQVLGRDALRIVLILFSLAALVGGAARELVVFFFGNAFEPSAPLLAILLLGSAAMLVFSVSTTILVALGQPGSTLKLTAPLVPLSVMGHLLLVPRFGGVGAAGVTAALASLVAVAGVFTVSRLWDLAPLRGTAWRSLAVTGLAYGLGVLFPVPGAWILVKLAIAIAIIVFAYWGLGEWNRKEVALAWSLLRMRINPASHPDE